MSLLKNKKVWAATGVVGCLGMSFVMLLVVIGAATLWAISGDETSTDSVTLSGQIVDGQTGQPPRQALFILLKPGVTYEEFMSQRNSREQAAALIQNGGYTDQSGYYTVPDIPRGYTYTIVATADGYEPFRADHALEINASDPQITRLKPIGLERPGTAAGPSTQDRMDDYVSGRGEFAQAQKPPIVLEGRLLDATTGNGIPDAQYIILRPGVTEEQFWGAASNHDAIRALVVNAGIADGQGMYRIEDLARGLAYPTIALAMGYEPIFFQDMVIDDGFPPVTRMQAIHLQRN